MIVVSGFSGSGKGTIMKQLLKKYEEQYALSVSATTRQPRPGEVDGREYFFRTTEQFEEMIGQDALIEYAQYVGNYYGTPKAYVEQQLAETPVFIKTPEVNTDRCNGCRQCIDFCKFNAIAAIQEKAVVFPDVCHPCGGCVLVLQHKALFGRWGE